MTDAERITQLEAQVAALTAPPPTASSFGGAVANFLGTLGSPDSILMGQLRGVLTTAGGALALKGYGDNSAWTQLIGVTMTFVGLVWSMLSKYVATHWLEVAVKAPASTTQPELAKIVAATAPGPVTVATVQTAVAQTKGGTTP